MSGTSHSTEMRTIRPLNFWVFHLWKKAAISKYSYGAITSHALILTMNVLSHGDVVSYSVWPAALSVFVAFVSTSLSVMPSTSFPPSANILLSIAFIEDSYNRNRKEHSTSYPRGCGIYYLFIQYYSCKITSRLIKLTWITLCTYAAKLRSAFFAGEEQKAKRRVRPLHTIPPSLSQR